MFVNLYDVVQTEQDQETLISLNIIDIDQWNAPPAPREEIPVGLIADEI